ISELETEIDTLKNERHDAIDEMRKAAADKDFKENAPLHAARERRSYLEGQIMKLESTLKAAVVINEKKGSNSRIVIGDSVILLDSGSGEELRYTLVSPREVDAARGKISSVSPIGQAILGKTQGDMVEISAPVGRLRFRVKKIEH
ncbi:MAG: GreA/GreB family elongation factor, partial [Dehalococcoidales bacterium]